MSLYNPDSYDHHCDALTIGAETYVVSDFSPSIGGNTIPIKDSADQVISNIVYDTKEDSASMTIEPNGTQTMLAIGSTFVYDEDTWVVADASASRSRGSIKTWSLNLVKEVSEA